MAWFDDPGRDDDIVVYGDFETPTDGGGDVPLDVKLGAASARDVLNSGGTLLVVLGGVSFVVGAGVAGHAWWTGAGAGAGLGLMGGGAVVAAVGAFGWWIGSQLDNIVRDPPQPDYRRPAIVVPASFDLGLKQLLPNAPIGRIALNLQVMAGLAPALLNAIERRAGAELAGDAVWVARWDRGIAVLTNDFMARCARHGAAFSDALHSPTVQGDFSREELQKSWQAMTGPGGSQFWDFLRNDLKLQPEIVDHVRGELPKFDPNMLPQSVGLQSVLGSLATGLDNTASTYLAAR